MLSEQRTRILAQSAPKVIGHLLLVLAALLAPAVAGAQAIAYSVALEAPKPLAELLENNLDLMRWRGNPQLDMDQLQRLLRAAPEQVRALVATEGYYSPEVSASLDTSGAQAVAHIVVRPGEPVRVGALDLVFKGFGATGAPYDTGALRSGWSLPEGAIFRQADWEGAKRKLLRLAVQTRYPRAQLQDSSATVDPQTRRAALHVVVDSGPEMHMGDLRIEGLQRYPERIVADLNPIKPGDQYSEAALQSFQQRLQDSGYFGSVDVGADLGLLAADEEAAPAQSITVPVLVRVLENKRKNVSVGGGYSTNTGNRAQVTYDDLSLFGLRLKSGITLETRRQQARADLYFPTTANGYNDSIGTSFERTDINGEVTSVSSVAAKRAWGSPQLERSVIVEYRNENKTVAGETEARKSQALPVSYNLTKRHLDSLLFPTNGYVLNAQLGLALLPILTEEQFVRGSLRVVGYRPLGTDTTLIVRAEGGALVSRHKSGVPSTYLFRAGGDVSVRGYGYQQLGVQEGDAIVGGRYLLDGSVELQHWFHPPWGAAVFYDAGNAGDVFRDLKPKSGYGVGVRWRSPVGPINVDLAYGHAVHKVRLHFSLGFVF
jgi:translocation and assembly module TamA